MASDTTEGVISSTIGNSQSIQRVAPGLYHLELECGQDGDGGRSGRQLIRRRSNYAIVLTGDNDTSDLRFANVDPPDVSLRNLDLTDKGRFYVSAASQDTDENAVLTSSFTVRLSSEPTDNVTIYASSSDTTEGVIYSIGGSTLNTSTLTFSSSDWNSPKSVVIKGVADNLSDGDQSYAIVLSADNTSSDLRFKYVDPPDVSLRNLDRRGEFIISSISGNLYEGGGTAVFTVKLKSQPLDNVTIPVSVSDSTEATISADNATHLLFTTENWAADHVVTLTSVDDNLSDGLQSFYVKLGADNSTSDLNYHGIDPQDVVVATVDDETAGFIITDVSGDTTESGGQAMFAMRLGSQPSSDVIVQFTSGDLSEAEVVTDNLTFNQSNWNGYQNVKVRGVDDNDTDGNITYPLEINVNSSSDSNFVGLDVPDVIFVNVDDETPGYTITSISGNTNEFGLKASFAIRLNTKPDNSSTPVQLAIRSSDTTEGIVSTTSVEFTDTNWNAYQYVTVTGIDDNVTDGNQGYFIEILPDNDTGDLNYLNKDPLDIYLVNLDNEQPGYIISSISGDTTEGGGEAVFSVRLMTQPDNSSTDVTLTFETSDSTEGTVSPNSVTFTYDNWKSYQNIKVTGVNDNISDGNQIFYVIINADNSTDDLNYRGFDPLDVPVVNVDDDIAGYFVSDISGDVYESGGNATFAIRLKTQPDNSSVNVTLSFSSSDTGEGTVSPDNLTFTYDDWNAYKNVTVYGVNDNLTDGNQTFSVIIEGDNQTLDSKYNSLDVDDIFVVNVDDDTPGFTITPISGPTSEDGGTATFTFKVNTVPDDLDSSTNNDNVTISISSSDTTEGTVYPSQLVFTKSNWNSENQITVTGVDDNVSDGNQSYSIILDVDNSTTAVGYSILNPSDVNLYNIDSDSPGFYVSSISGDTDENLKTATFTVSLSSAPSSDNVTITMKSFGYDRRHGDLHNLRQQPDRSTTPRLVFTELERGPDGDDDRCCGQSFRRGPVLRDPSEADNTTSDLGYANVDPEDVTVKNLDYTAKGGFYVSSISGDTDESELKDGDLHGESFERTFFGQRDDHDEVLGYDRRGDLHFDRQQPDR